MTVQAEKANEARYNIRVLDRAIRILELLSDGKPRTHLEVSEGIGLSPSTTFRLLATLCYYNYTKRDEHSNQYSLGLACLELARAYQGSNDLRRVAIPELEALRDDIKETVHLCVLDQMEIVYLEKLSGLHAIGIMSSRIGGRSPAHCTGVGKVLLAYTKPEVVRGYFQEHGLARFTDTTITNLEALENELSAIRENGYGFDHGEHEHEVRCVATPIFDISGEAVAALSISGPRDRMEPLHENIELIEKAKQTARQISRQLGYHPGP
jgi:DNA-binding IclR family transcriptional regulator